MMVRLVVCHFSLVFWNRTDHLFSLNDVELLRMGTVEAITTPSATEPPHRLSFMGDVHGGVSQESLSLSRSQSQSQLQVNATANNDSSASLLEPRPPLLLASSSVMSLPHSRSSRGSPLPAALHSATTEVTRSSYLTDGTGASRISGLSEFPVPPSQTVVPSDRVEVLKSFFLLRSIVLLRHRRRPGRYAHDYRVQSAPVGCPSRAGRLLVMLTTTHRSDCSTPDFDPQGPPFLVILSIFFCLTYQFAATRGWINTAPWNPRTHSYVISCSKLL